LPPRKLISIIIPAFNSTQTLNRTLPSIIAQDWSLIEEVVVVDSSDDERMGALIGKYEIKGIRFINAGKRVMPAIQRNIGARASSGELIVFLDSDVILSAGYITKIAEYYRAGHMSGFGAVEVPSFQAKKILPLAQYFLQLNEYLPRGKARIMPFVSGCNNFCARRIFEAAGGFPEVRASEDVLFGINIRKLTEIWFFPDACVAHIFREEWPGFKKNQEMLGKYVAKYRKKVSSSLVFRGPAPFILYPVFLGVKLIKMIPRILAAGPRTAFHLLRVLPVFLIGLCYWTNGFVKEIAIKEPLSETTT